MKRIIISLLFIITVLCGYFYEKQKAIVYQKEVNEGLQQYLNERNNDEDRASSHVRKDVIDYTNQRPERREIAPSPLKQLKTQFMQPFKGRAFQELLDMSESLNSILHCDTLDVAQRASILSKITNKPYSEMNALVSEVDRCISECCDSPCFAAIQDSIIYSYTDETLDVYWYYKVQGQDSVLMFNIVEYKKDYPELYFLEDLTTDANMLDWKAMITAFAASARQSSQLDDSIYKATFEQIYAMGFIVGLNDGDCTAQQLFERAKHTAGMTPQEILTENYQNDLPEMDTFGLIKQIHDPQEFYDLITGDQKDFGFYFMLIPFAYCFFQLCLIAKVNIDSKRTSYMRKCSIICYFSQFPIIFMCGVLTKYLPFGIDFANFVITIVAANILSYMIIRYSDCYAVLKNLY